jgi:hypothetical protein
MFALPDHEGSIRDVASGVLDGYGSERLRLVNHINFDSFGNILADSVENIDYLFGFTGRESDKETGLQYNRARLAQSRLDATAGHD